MRHQIGGDLLHFPSEMAILVMCFFANRTLESVMVLTERFPAVRHFR